MIHVAECLEPRLKQSAWNFGGRLGIASSNKHIVRTMAGFFKSDKEDVFRSFDDLFNIVSNLDFHRELFGLIYFLDMVAPEGGNKRGDQSSSHTDMLDNLQEELWAMFEEKTELSLRSSPWKVNRFYLNSVSRVDWVLSSMRKAA